MPKTSHKWRLVIRRDAKKVFDTLQRGHKQSIFRSLQQLLEADNPYELTFVEQLREGRFNKLHKFRVGDYRVFFNIDSREVEQQG